MLDKDKLLEKLRSMSTDDVVAIVEKAWAEANEGWVECKNCIHSQDGECWLMEMRDGCYHGESIVEITDD